MRWGLLVLGTIGVASVLPIWRGAGHCRHHGISLWSMLYHTGDIGGYSKDVPAAVDRIPYGDARRRAREAYMERFGRCL